jgi:tetratricopeptide (TPR) repeat protein
VAAAKFWQGIGGLHLVPYININIALALSSLDRREKALLLIDEAIQIIDQTNHRMHEAEAYRVKGELLISPAQVDVTAAEHYLLKAIDVARSQHAKGWELLLA